MRTNKRAETKQAAGGIVVLDGYGLKIYVQRGHLVVHDGLGRDRRCVRFSRATSRLTRLVVIGHEGYVTLEALRWIRDVGASFVQIDHDANLIAIGARERLHESKLRRAQVLAAGTEVGKIAVVELLREKLAHQIRIAARLSNVKATIVRKHRYEIRVPDAIREQAALLEAHRPFSELRKIESIAGRYYWQTWAQVPINFDARWRGTVPEHWHKAGPRTSRVDRKWPRRAFTPAHALLNYVYAILETEAIIASQTVGLDPSLGLMHTDQRYRTSMAMDLMEPSRPVADELVLNLLEARELKRGDVYETRDGICRLGASLVHELAAHAPTLRTAVAPHAENVARILLSSPMHPTPLTRERYRKAMMAAGRI